MDGLSVNWGEFGAYATILVVFALTMRSILLSTVKNVSKREENLINMMLKSSENIQEHTNSIKAHTKLMEQVGNLIAGHHEKVIGQIRKSESSIKRALKTKK